MRVKIELEPNEKPEEADALLVKSVQAKHECTGSERYADAWLNELEAHVCAEHRKVLDQIRDELIQAIVHANQ